VNFTVNGHNIFLIVGICFLVSVILVYLMKKVAIYMDITDKPGERKLQKEPVPLLGGIGIYMAFLIGYMLFAPKNNLMLSILIASFVLLLLGLFDDVTKSNKPMKNKYKIIVQLVVAAIIVFYGGLRLDFIRIFNLFLEFPPIVSSLLSIIIIIGIINMVNLIDGLDGLCAGISSIYFITIATIGFILNKFGGLDVILCLIMLGATLGYLFHNYPPAKIYQGDAGSTFLGLMIAVIFLIGFKTSTLTSLIIPLIVLAIPILDTLFAIIRRVIVKKQKFDQADKEHIHHQFLKKFSKKSSLLIIYAINIVFSITTIFYVLNRTTEVIICYIFFVFVVLFLVFKTDIIFERDKRKNKLNKRKTNKK